MNHSKFSEHPPKVVPDKLYPLPVACSLLGKDEEAINRSSFYRWARLGIIKPTRDSRGQLCLYGHELHAFWSIMTESLLFGSYPPWRKNNNSKHGPTPNGPINIALI